MKKLFVICVTAAASEYLLVLSQEVRGYAIVF
jgi:hypothetical protein